MNDFLLICKSNSMGPKLDQSIQHYANLSRAMLHSAGSTVHTNSVQKKSSAMLHCAGPWMAPLYVAQHWTMFLGYACSIVLDHVPGFQRYMPQSVGLWSSTMPHSTGQKCLALNKFVKLSTHAV
jgi:hypothetical protein